MTASALHEDGLAQVWDRITALTDWRRAQGHWDTRRAAQARRWFEDEVRQALLARLETPSARAALQAMGAQVEGGSVSPAAAALAVLAALDQGVTASTR